MIDKLMIKIGKINVKSVIFDWDYKRADPLDTIVLLLRAFSVIRRCLVLAKLYKDSGMG